MTNRRPYEHRFMIFSGWMVKAIGLVVAGAATMILAMTIKKEVSFKSESPQSGKFVGIRHEATAVPGAAVADVDCLNSSLSGDQDASTESVVHRGVTVVTPHLLVPVIDTALIDAATASVDDSSVKASSGRKISRYGKRSHSRGQTRLASTRWSAYGMALR